MATVGTITLAKGDILTSAHVFAISRANDGYGVLSGCDVHEQSPAAMGITIDSGYILYNGSYVAVTGGNISVDAADATNPRIDIVYINNSGSPLIAKGTAAAILPSQETSFKKMTSPYPLASIPLGVILARIYVAAGVTSILNSVIDDISAMSAQVPLNTLTTRGDIPFKGADGGWARLPKGNSGYALVQGANDPSWVQLDHNTHLSNLNTGDVHTQYLNSTRGDARYALIASGVTNGDSHDHNGGDGAQIDHGNLSGLSDDDHTIYYNQTRGDARYALIASGVTNGDSHNHSGGDGGQITHKALSDIGSNSHYSIDNHIANTSNPHSTTAAQLGADITTTTVAWAPTKATPVDADEIPILDSAASYGLKNLTWSNLKATNKTYTDTLYSPTSHTHSGYALVANGVTNGNSHDHNGGDGAQIAYSSLSGTPPRIGIIPFAFGDGSMVIQEGWPQGSYEVEMPPFATRITTCRIHTPEEGVSGSITCRLYKRAFIGGYTELDQFVISSGERYEETGLSISVNASDWLLIVVSGISTFKQITCSLTVEAV
jgi:hypothetical protein